MSFCFRPSVLSGLAVVATLTSACVPARRADDAQSAAALGRGEVGTSAEAPTGPRRPGDEGVPGALPPERAPAPAGRSGPYLDRTRLIREVLAKNPSVEARRHAWRAARAQKRAVDSWDDPMLGYEVAPLSIFSSDTRFGQTIRLSQRVPWPGKLSSASDAADEVAAAEAEVVSVTELDLALQASLLFDDYWSVERALDVNREHRNLLEELRRGAEIQYSVGRGSLSDPLQADVEMVMLAEQDIGLESKRDVVGARLNALLHRPPEAALPAPAARNDVSLAAPPTSQEVQRAAILASPELRALAARSRAAQAEIRHAERQYYPDVTLMASYSSMWMELEHQIMIGIEAPIPIQRGSRGGAVDVASARAAEVRSETLRVVDGVRERAETARFRVLEGIRIVKLYEGRLIPAARDQVAAARADFATSKVDFASVIQAEKSLRGIELGRYMAMAELSKRRARLWRALGRLPDGTQQGGTR